MTHLLFVDLLLENDTQFGKQVLNTLKRQGHRITTVQSAMSLAAGIAIYRPDAVLIELKVDSINERLDICRRLRAWNTLPTIALSASNDEILKVQALDAGFDDYLPKPFGVNELLARIRAIQRRSKTRMGSNTPLIQIDTLSVNLDTHQVRLDGQTVHLTQREFSLLRALILAQGRAVSYSTLLKIGWGREDTGKYACIRTVVERLRIKLNDDASNPRFILTENTFGYRFNGDDQAVAFQK